MHSYEKRKKAVGLYIKHGKSACAVIRGTGGFSFQDAQEIESIGWVLA
ncbi:MAG: hypothetical protein WCR02_01010 [Sphaerochaetaceae bacterium]|jgi:hypothetical protein